MSKAIMIQGTGSNVGKSMIVAGLARAYANRGLSVMPFKPQNMSNNAAVTLEGGELGRAQALQALAARVPAHTDMNPVLLKPETETGAQVILHGKRVGHQNARHFGQRKTDLMPHVLDSFYRLNKSADLVIVEGAGSPAETNLRQGDIANMGFARAAEVPVILAGDIDRGGVIAQLVGTKAVLDDADANLIKGFIVNRFRGDVSLFDGGRVDIENRTRWPCLGVIPWFHDAHLLPAEDVLDLAQAPSGRSGGLHVVVPQLPRISNFDDLDPLAAEAGVDLEIITSGTPIPATADVVILVGSKATLADLASLRTEGWDIDIAAHVRRGGHVLGLCGGYQMLGQSVSDPEGVEGDAGHMPGLGLLTVDTRLLPNKKVRLVEGQHTASNTAITGYEIHMGETNGPDCANGWLQIDGIRHGAASPNGRIQGCYVHGLFGGDAFRAAWLARFDQPSDLRHSDLVDETLDALAAHLEVSLDLDRLFDLARPPAPR